MKETKPEVKKEAYEKPEALLKKANLKDITADNKTERYYTELRQGPIDWFYVKGED